MDIAANVLYTDVLKKYVISKGMYDHVKRNLNSFISKNIISNDTSLKHGFDLDGVIFKTYMNLRDKNIPINGNILKQNGIRISKDIGFNNFKTSNNWLKK
ncbi:Major centromere autoantigen B [Dictyocoela muelleri]|nr:Major centromere autoantigen B [Dictyocoela muelleri]